MFVASKYKILLTKKQHPNKTSYINTFYTSSVTMSLDIMRWLESFYMWILIGVIVFSCCCYCLEPLLVNRMQRGDVLHHPKCEVYHNVLMDGWEHPHRITMPSDNRIPPDNRLQVAHRQQNEIIADR